MAAEPDRRTCMTSSVLSDATVCATVADNRTKSRGRTPERRCPSVDTADT